MAGGVDEETIIAALPLPSARSFQDPVHGNHANKMDYKSQRAGQSREKKEWMSA